MNDLTLRSGGKKTYHHGDLKAALVAAGMETLEEGGLESLSLRGIAARVGVSHAAPKNHFAGLGGLLTAIAAEGFRRHAAAMRGTLDEAATPEARLAAASQGYVDFALAHPALFRLMFSPTLCDHSDPALSEAGSDSFTVLAGIAEGLDWRPIDGGEPTPRQTQIMLWSTVHGYATLAISGQLALGDGGAPPFPATAILPAFAYR